MTELSAVERKLLYLAVLRYGTIHPCQGKSLRECFTVAGGSVQLWFNDDSGNTHRISRRLRVPA